MAYYMESKKRLSRASLALFLVFTLFQTLPTTALLAQADEVMSTSNVHDETASMNANKKIIQVIGLSLFTAIGLLIWWKNSGNKRFLPNSGGTGNIPQPQPHAQKPLSGAQQATNSTQSNKNDSAQKELVARRTEACNLIKGFKDVSLDDKDSAELEGLLSKPEDKKDFKTLVDKVKGFTTDNKLCLKDDDIVEKLTAYIVEKFTKKEIERFNELIVAIDVKLRLIIREKEGPQKQAEDAAQLINFPYKTPLEKAQVLKLFSSEDANRFNDLLNKYDSSGTSQKMSKGETEELRELSNKLGALHEEALARRGYTLELINLVLWGTLRGKTVAELEVLLSTPQDKEDFQKLLNKAKIAFKHDSLLHLDYDDIVKNLEKTEAEQLGAFFKAMIAKEAEIAKEKEDLIQKILNRLSTSGWGKLKKEEVLELFSFRADKDETDVSRFKALLEKMNPEGTSGSFEKNDISNKLTKEEIEQLGQLTNKLSIIFAKRAEDKKARAEKARKIIEGKAYKSLLIKSRAELEELLSNFQDKETIKGLINKAGGFTSGGRLDLISDNIERRLLMSEIEQLDKFFKTMANMAKANEKSSALAKIFPASIYDKLQGKSSAELEGLLLNPQDKKDFKELVKKAKGFTSNNTLCFIPKNTVANEFDERQMNKLATLFYTMTKEIDKTAKK